MKRPAFQSSTDSSNLTSATWLLSFGDLLTLLLCFFLALVATGELQMGVQREITTGDPSKGASRDGTHEPRASLDGTAFASSKTTEIEMILKKEDLSMVPLQVRAVALRDEITARGGEVVVHSCGREFADSVRFATVISALLDRPDGAVRVVLMSDECSQIAPESETKAKIVGRYGNK